MYAKIIVQYGVKKLDKEFTYLVPEVLAKRLKVGMKVLVPFGYQEIIGFVTNITSNLEEKMKLKEIIDIADENLVLNEELQALGKYMQETYLCTLISAYQTMLPSSLKIKIQKHNYDLYEDYLVINDVNKALKYKELFGKKRKAQEKLLDDILTKKEVKKSEYSTAVVSALLNTGIISKISKRKYRINKLSKIEEKNLNDEQQTACDKVLASLNNYHTFLLYGVTGSGKTEVYIKIIKEVIKRGKTAIVLVPEISLTTQISARFYNAFGDDVAILHSGLSEGEKYDEYVKIYEEKVKIVVGTRSAVFAPLKNIGIIIIDEEDAGTYKQDNNPRYHARDIAIYRAKYHKAPLVLGSATPSLESKARADKNVYELITIKKRARQSKLPQIFIIDMTKEVKNQNYVFSKMLQDKINERLAKNEQVILLLNRRGFSTFISCSNCGYVYKCPVCDISLTYHKTSNMLTCHFCGYQTPRKDRCPKCGENALNYLGMGTEKLESLIESTFPKARVIRMDQDTTRNKGKHEEIIKDFSAHKYNVLVGTQMISKGLDFPLVTLVGIINADTSLNIPDFRAGETTFTLLHQASGRSGRKDKEGEVVIQTFNPDNYVIKYAQKGSYDDFYLEEMYYRHKLKYPPYYFIVSLKIIGKEYNECLKKSEEVKKFLNQNLPKEMIILGPSMAAVFRFKNTYRMQVLIKYKKEENLKKVLKLLENSFLDDKNNILEIDFNPLRI